MFDDGCFDGEIDCGECQPMRNELFLAVVGEVQIFDLYGADGLKG